MPTLPIAIESRVVHVPCALPSEFQVGVSMGGTVVGFAVELTSRDPLTAQVKGVECDTALLLSAHDSLKARAAAEVSLSFILRRLGLDPFTRQPAPVLEEGAARILPLIAKAQEGEQEAKDSAEEANALLPGFAQIDVRGHSRAVSLLEAYIDSVIDAVQAEQEDRAEAEAGQGQHAHV